MKELNRLQPQGPKPVHVRPLRRYPKKAALGEGPSGSTLVTGMHMHADTPVFPESTVDEVFPSSEELLQPVWKVGN